MFSAVVVNESGEMSTPVPVAEGRRWRIDKRRLPDPTPASINVGLACAPSRETAAVTSTSEDGRGVSTEDGARKARPRKRGWGGGGGWDFSRSRSAKNLAGAGIVCEKFALSEEQVIDVRDRKRPRPAEQRRLAHPLEEPRQRMDAEPRAAMICFTTGGWARGGDVRVMMCSGPSVLEIAESTTAMAREGNGSEGNGSSAGRDADAGSEGNGSSAGRDADAGSSDAITTVYVREVRREGGGVGGYEEGENASARPDAALSRGKSRTGGGRWGGGGAAGTPKPASAPSRFPRSW
jgi:hypothetical protein